VLKRFPNGVAEPFFFQKRAPKTYEWLEIAKKQPGEAQDT